MARPPMWHFSRDNRPSRGDFPTGICIDEVVTVEKTAANSTTTREA